MSLNHKGTVVLETPRLLLRPVVAEDAQSFFDSSLCNPEVTRFISIPTHSGVEETSALLQKSIDSYEQPAYYFWAVEPKSWGRMGGIMLAFAVDERSHKCEVGYCLGNDFWGQGLTVEGLRALLEFLFAQVGFMRLEARCNIANSASARVLEKCGFKCEGIMRKSFMSNVDGYVDMFLYALLREEWEQK